jgi:hypothetical protein
MEEWMARQQQRREGRVRAGPVLIRSRGTLEPRDVPELASTAQPSSNPFKTPDDYTMMPASNPFKTPDGYTTMPSSNPFKTPDGYTAIESLISDTGGPVPSNEPPQLRPQRALSTDNDSSSSDSSTSTETGSGLFAFISTGKASGKSKKTSKQASESSAAADGQRKSKAKLPRLWTKGGHPSVEDASQGPALDKKQRKRCYSFEKGDDEVLSVTSPTWPPGMFSPPQSPVEEEAAAQAGGSGLLSVLSGQADGLWKGADGGPRQGPEGATIKHSTSTNTVKWVGDGTRAGKSVDGKAGHGQTEDSA